MVMDATSSLMMVGVMEGNTGELPRWENVDYKQGRRMCGRGFHNAGDLWSVVGRHWSLSQPTDCKVVQYHSSSQPLVPHRINMSPCIIELVYPN